MSRAARVASSSTETASSSVAPTLAPTPPSRPPPAGRSTSRATSARSTSSTRTAAHQPGPSSSLTRAAAVRTHRTSRWPRMERSGCPLHRPIAHRAERRWGDRAAPSISRPTVRTAAGTPMPPRSQSLSSTASPRRSSRSRCYDNSLAMPAPYRASRRQSSAIDVTTGVAETPIRSREETPSASSCRTTASCGWPSRGASTSRTSRSRGSRSSIRRRPRRSSSCTKRIWEEHRAGGDHGRVRRGDHRRLIAEEPHVARHVRPGNRYSLHHGDKPRLRADDRLRPPRDALGGDLARRRQSHDDRGRKVRRSRLRIPPAPARFRSAPTRSSSPCSPSRSALPSNERAAASQKVFRGRIARKPHPPAPPSPPRPPAPAGRAGGT